MQTSVTAFVNVYEERAMHQRMVRFSVIVDTPVTILHFSKAPTFL